MAHATCQLGDHEPPFPPAEEQGEYRLRVSFGQAHLRQLLAARDRHTIASRLHRFHEAVGRADLPEATRLAETVDAWWPEILGFLETGITNAATEGTNRLVKDAARTAFGFRNLDNQRRRVRFHCTRHSRRTTSGGRALPPQLR